VGSYTPGSGRVGAALGVTLWGQPLCGRGFASEKPLSSAPCRGPFCSISKTVVFETLPAPFRTDALSRIFIHYRQMLSVGLISGMSLEASLRAGWPDFIHLPGYEFPRIILLGNTVNREGNPPSTRRKYFQGCSEPSATLSLTLARYYLIHDRR
jgi:hypothetical protein